jgi:hypothetical protein
MIPLHPRIDPIQLEWIAKLHRDGIAIWAIETLSAAAGTPRIADGRGAAWRKVRSRVRRQTPSAEPFPQLSVRECLAFAAARADVILTSTTKLHRMAENAQTLRDRLESPCDPGHISPRT